MIASHVESLPQQPAGTEPARVFRASKKGRKDGPGLFAKLLSGLTKKTGDGFPLSGASPEEARAAEGGEPGAPGLRSARSAARLGARPGGMSGGTPDALPGESSGARPPKTGGQKALAGLGLSRSPGGALETEDPAGAGLLEKPGEIREEEGNGETLYLLGRAEIPATTLRSPEDPGGEDPFPGWEEAESGLWVEGVSPAETPEASGLFPQETYFSGSGPEFPGSAETAAGEAPVRKGHPDGAEGFSGLEGKLAAEFSRPGESKPGPGVSGKTEKDEKPAARRAERRRERSAVFETRDLRGGQETGAPGIKEGALPEGKQPPGQEIDLSVELKNESRGGERASAGGEKTLSQAFEDILSRELHQNLNGDIVRHASVILRDGGEGLIRLSLKPDTLGNVKIRLEMAENKITGHIVVESGEALRAFEREIGALEQAFRDSGFDGADLNMSLASGDPGAEGRREGGGDPFFSERFAAEQAASRYDALTEKRDVLFAIGSANGLKPGNGRISVNLLI